MSAPPTETFAQIIARLPSYEAYLAELGGTNTFAGADVRNSERPRSKSAPPHTIPHAPGDQFADTQAPEPGKASAPLIVPDMVAIPAGRFMMGATPNDPDRLSDEAPRREIVIPAPIAISRAPITFEQWDACLADGGTRHRPDDHGWGRSNRPVINVSWHDAQEYIGWLNRRLDLPPEHRYRLLSEAEWEYAAHAGHDYERFPWGEDLDGRQLAHYAWHYGNSGGRIQPVGGKPANAFGLLDMLGNVTEWVQDHYSSDYRPHAADGRPYLEDSRHAQRVLRGGSWLDRLGKLRPAARKCMSPTHRSYEIGFRIARNL